MMGWWAERTDRERLLIGAGAGVVLLLAVFQFVYVPVSDYRDRAEDSHAAALDYLADVKTAVARYESMAGTRSDAEQVLDARSLRALITETAGRAGLQVTRLQPGQNGALTVWIDTGDGRAVMAWLTRLASEPGLGVGAVSVRQADAGGIVQAQVTFQPA